LLDVRYCPIATKFCIAPKCRGWANSCREQVQQKSAAEGLIYSITSSAMVRLFSEQAFKNLARPWGQLRGCNCRRRVTTRGGHPNPGIDRSGIMRDLFLSMITYFPQEDRMDRLEGIKIFVRVVESGSFSAVARELGTGQPAISKQVAALEEHLGAQLLMRTSRSLSLTEAGRDFYESAVRLISDLEAAESRVGSGQASPSGVVRVTAAPGFSPRYVVPKLLSFRARYPNVVVEMLVSERTSNLVEEGIDLAIRNGALADSSLIARKIGEFAVVAVASAEYLERRGEPTRLSDLDGHDGVIFV